MKIIFLDVDGVLNSDEYIDNLVSQNKPPLTQWIIDPSALLRFNLLCSVSKAEVVMSSTWRLHKDKESMTYFFRSVGYTGPDILDYTPNLPRRMSEFIPRHCEIEAWLENKPIIENFVILDDVESAEIEHHFVHTSYKIGLTDEDVQKSLNILNSSKGVNHGRK